ncbi:MAG: non-ribosomal peptide synthetase, partial [Gemmatimonadetes bacterium]|nr:non-ribosomal peptide synthetase [Gemmatimonadota bacterium]
ERAEVTHAPNATARPRPPATVHALVSARAARTPHAVAIEHAGERVTYAELEARANRLAHRLRRLGVGPDVRVAIAMERSPELVVTTLAVIKAGGCYVAVDPAYPAERVAYMLSDSRAAVVVTSSAVAARLPAADAVVLATDAERDAIAAEPADDPGVAVDPENLLYVLYTSGSTGRPKGAALPHRALANLLRWQVERWGEMNGGSHAETRRRGGDGTASSARDAGDAGDTGDAGDDRAVETAATTTRSLPSQTTGAAAAEGEGRVTGGGDAEVHGRAGGGDESGMRTLQFASLSFDVSFQEIYGTWISGGTLVLIDDDTRRDPDALLAYLRRERIGRLFLPFAALQSLAEAAEGGDAHLPGLREVITAGEALRSTPQLRAFFRANPRARLENQYGPSETHVVSAHALAADAGGWDALPPIGVPVDNTRLYVLDRRMNPAPLGVPGELYAGGDNLARGYLARPALTAERFIPDPFGAPGSRLYRTGDRARWRRRAELEYLGRTDFQVKIRGFRVEPGEVEAALAEHPSVAQAAVAVRGEGAARRLAAYVVPAAGTEADVAALRAYLAGRLPGHMVPAAWRVMDALPLTPSGKIDRRSLPDPTPERRPDAVPRSAAERTVSRVWARVLGVDTVGADDNFFEIGGHSLLLARVRQGLRDAMGCDVAMLDLFQFPTVRTLAAHLDAARRADPPPAQGDASPEQPSAAPVADAAARAGFDRAALRRELLRRGKR